MLRAAALAVAMFGLGGCVRAGFGPDAGTVVSRDGPGFPERDGEWRRDGESRGEPTPKGDTLIRDGVQPTAVGDTCAAASTIDVGGLASPQSITVNTTVAKDDYSFAGCAGLPDVVVHLTGFPQGEMTSLGCSGGGGSVSFGYRNDAGCGNTVSVFGSFSCNGGSIQTFAAQGPEHYVIFCRASSAGPATVTFKRGFL